jgi:hypothetical protein
LITTRNAKHGNEKTVIGATVKKDKKEKIFMHWSHSFPHPAAILAKNITAQTERENEKVRTSSKGKKKI